MTRTLERHVLEQVVVPFTIGVSVLTFFLIIDGIYHLTERSE